MTSFIELDQPAGLAALTAPIDRKNGRTFASAVHALRGLGRRRRTEVAVAADGSNIEIYNIQSTAKVATYPFPPQSRFIGPAASVFCKASHSAVSKRFTYACVRSETGSDGVELVGFAENVRRTVSASPERFSVQLASPEAAPVLLDTYSIARADGAEDHNVLLVRANGAIDCYSSDLSNLRWRCTELVRRPSSGSARVVHASLVELSKAQRGLLKSRNDLIARLDAGAGPKGVQVLPVVLVDGAAVKLHICALLPVETEQAAVSVVYLDKWTLPISEPDADQGQWTVDASTGKAFLHSAGKITTVDLSGIAPTLSSVFSLPKGDFTSVYLGSNLVLLSGQSSNFVCDLFYSSILARGVNEQQADASASSKKRKRPADSAAAQTSSPFVFVTYFSKMKTAIGFQNGELMSLPLGQVQIPSSSRAESRLIDSLGKGVQTPDRPAGAQPKTGEFKGGEWTLVEANLGAEWKSTREKLDECLSRSDMAGFEELFAASVGLGSLKEEDVPETEEMFLEGNAWYLLEDREPIPRSYLHQAQYAIRTIFSLEPSKAGSGPVLQVKRFPHNIFRWLALGGHLTACSIEAAFLSEEGTYVSPEVSPAMFISSLVAHDRTMRLLHDFLNLQNYLDAPTIMQVIKTVVASLDTDGVPPEPVLRIGNAAEDVDMDAVEQRQQKDGGSGSSSTIAAATDGDVSESEEAERDLARAITALEHGTEIRGQSLRQALVKLHSLPLSTAAANMRAHLSVQETIFLIQILRLELVQNGWTSRYLSDDQDEDAEVDAYAAGSDDAVTLITDMISCAVDAVGVSGWLSEAAAQQAGGASSDDDDDDDGTAHKSGSAEGAEGLLASLQSQVAFTLEGMQDSAFLNGVLGGFLKYTADHAAHAAAAAAAAGPRAPGGAKRTGAVVSLDEDDADKQLLPLGCKVDELTRIRSSARKGLFNNAGGAGGRTGKAYRGNEISKRVGKYSRETIRF